MPPKKSGPGYVCQVVCEAKSESGTIRAAASTLGMSFVAVVLVPRLATASIRPVSEVLPRAASAVVRAAPSPMLAGAAPRASVTRFTRALRQGP